MGTLSSSIFQQARLLVAQADREMADLAARFESSFQLSREEREELRPSPVDAYDAWSIELAPRDGSAVFLMTPQDDRTWALAVARGEDMPLELGRFQAGQPGNEARRRLHAARVVSAIGSWLENKTSAAPPSAPDRIVSLEGKAYIEFKAQAHMSSPQAHPQPAQTQSSIQVQPASRPKAPDSSDQPSQARILESTSSQSTQPRWLDMLPGAQAGDPEALPPALLEPRQQVAFRLGKIFGH
jgi:hypothetical protein